MPSQWKIAVSLDAKFEENLVSRKSQDLPIIVEDTK